MCLRFRKSLRHTFWEAKPNIDALLYDYVSTLRNIECVNGLPYVWLKLHSSESIDLMEFGVSVP